MGIFGIKYLFDFDKPKVEKSELLVSKLVSLSKVSSELKGRELKVQGEEEALRLKDGIIACMLKAAKNGEHKYTYILAGNKVAKHVANAFAEMEEFKGIGISHKEAEWGGNSGILPYIEFNWYGRL